MTRRSRIARADGRRAVGGVGKLSMRSCQWLLNFGAGRLGGEERLEQFVPDVHRGAGAIVAHASLNRFVNRAYLGRQLGLCVLPARGADLENNRDMGVAATQAPYCTQCVSAINA